MREPQPRWGDAMHRAALAPAATHEAMAPLTRRLQRIAGLLLRLSGTRASYYDPYAEVIEDDYYRFRNQPRDWDTKAALRG